MSTNKLPHYVLLELPDVTEIIKSPLKSTQRIKYTCFDVSKSLIVFGATSGGIYVFNRHPCEFIQLIPNKDGAITRLAVSADERRVGFANGRGLLAATECEQTASHKTTTSKEHQGNEVTALAWRGSALFAGDDTGRISVLVVPGLITKTIFQSGAQTIMSLDSRVCQIDVRDCMLLASTLTRTYVCDTSQEQYRQIGQKLRDGEYGACFLTKDKCVNGLTDCKDYTEAKQFNIVADDAFKVNDNLKGTAIYCARPSLRIWEASIDGTVVRTHQFKQVLTGESTNVVIDANGDVAVEKLCKELEGKSLNFPKVLSLKSSAIFTFKKDALFFLNINNVDQTTWSERYSDIVDCRVYNDFVYVWLTNGSLVSVNYLFIEKCLMKCYLDGKFRLCAKLCALYRDYLISNPLSQKMRILANLKDSLEEDQSNDIKDVLEKFESLKNTEATQLKSGIFVVENSFHSQAICDDEYKETVDNKFPTLKDISTTVTDKINTSKKLLKDKWEGFEDKMKHLGETFEIDLPKKLERPLDNNQDSIENNGEIPCEENSQEPSKDTDECESDVEICKILYTHYVLSSVDDKSVVAEDLEKYTKDITDVYKLMKALHEYCTTTEVADKYKFMPNHIFLEYIEQSERKTNCIDDIIKDDELHEYFVESCIKMNSYNISNLGCECGYPLPYSKTNQQPKYSDIIDALIERQWSTRTKAECYEMCKRMPYLWRKMLFLRRNDDLVQLLTMLLQILDESLLHTFLPQFTIDTWSKTVQLYGILQTNICLNCNKRFDNISVKSTLSWDVLGELLIKSVGGKQALKVMDTHADLIGNGELSLKFYHTCFLVDSFEKYDGTIRNDLVDTLYGGYDCHEVVSEICKLLRTIKDGDVKNTSLPIIAAANSTCWGLNITNDQEIYPQTEEVNQNEDNYQKKLRKYLGMDDIFDFLNTSYGDTDCSLCGLSYTNEVLIQDGGLWCFRCGHVFHGACLDLNKVKLCPSCAVKV